MFILEVSMKFLDVLIAVSKEIFDVLLEVSKEIFVVLLEVSITRMTTSIKAKHRNGRTNEH